MSIISTNSQGIFYTTLEYLRKKFNIKGETFSQASPFYMLISAMSSIVGQLFHYLHRAEVEKNIDTAEYKHSIFGLARLAGYNPFRGKSARGVINLYASQYIAIRAGTRVKIGGSIFFVDGEDDKVFISKNANAIDLNVIQGTKKSYSFVSDGSALQSFTPICNMTDDDLVEVYVNGRLWNRKLSLYDMTPNSEDYILRTSISHGLTIVFGDGTNGKKLDNGSTITIVVVETDGSVGNGNPSSKIEWIDSAYDIDGEVIDINTNSSFVLKTPPSGGVDYENIEKVRYSATRASSMNVLATKDNFRAYLSLFDQYKVYDIISPDDMNSSRGIVFIKAIMNLSNICKDDVMKLYTLKDNDYIIPTYNGTNELEKILKDSGKLLLGTTTKVISPIIRHYVINIGIRAKSGYSNIQIKNNVQREVASFILNNKRNNIIPCSDMVVAIDKIEGVDTVTISLVSEYNEQAHINGYYYKEWVEFNDNNTKFETKKIKFATGEEELGISNGDIIIDKSELWILKGGFKDRFGQYYSESIGDDSLGCVNVLFIQ